MTYITESAAIELYNEVLDDGGDITIGLRTYQPSAVLAAVDPIAYHCGLADFLDAAELSTKQSECTPA